jgi:hypothetical protein
MIVACLPLHVGLPLGVLELVEALVTRSVDVRIAVYRAEATGGVREAAVVRAPARDGDQLR